MKNLKDHLLDNEAINVKKKREKAQGLKYLRKLGEKMRNGRGKGRKRSGSRPAGGLVIDIKPTVKDDHSSPNSKGDNNLSPLPRQDTQKTEKGKKKSDVSIRNRPSSISIENNRRESVRMKKTSDIAKLDLQQQTESEELEEVDEMPEDLMSPIQLKRTLIQAHLNEEEEDFCEAIEEYR